MLCGGGYGCRIGLRSPSYFFGQDVGHTLHQYYGFHVLNCVSLSTENMQYILHLLYSVYVGNMHWCGDVPFDQSG